METGDEWYYTMLLELLKQKEQDKNDTHYKQLELELPLDEKTPEVKEEQQQDKQTDRGVVIIDT